MILLVLLVFEVLFDDPLVGCGCYLYIVFTRLVGSNNRFELYFDLDSNAVFDLFEAVDEADRLRLIGFEVMILKI